MKKVKFILAAFVFAIALCSCEGFGGKTTPSFRLSDLQGLWKEDKANMEHYVRFTTEQADEAGYLFGREWNEEEDVYEEDLYVYVKDSLGQDSLIHGNGWFQYKLESKGDLEEIHFMENGGAEIPKEYIVAILTSSRLEYYEKDNKNKRSYFNRMTETLD